MSQFLRTGASAVLAQAMLHGELMKVEWAEEKYRLVRMLISLLAGTLFLFLSLLSLSALAVVFSWDTQYRIPVLLMLTGLYCIGTGVACYRFCSLAALGKYAFADTRAELGADLALVRNRLAVQQ